MFAIIGAIIIGFFAGLLPRAIHPGDDKLGFWLTAALGIVGALTATFLGKIIGLYQAGQSAGFLMSVAGAVLVLFVYTQFFRKKLS